MIRHLNILILLCGIAVTLSVAATFYFIFFGNIKFIAVGGVASLLFFSLLVVLMKERRVARIMTEDDYDKEHEPF